MLTIVNYGLGNIGSIANMLRKIGHPTLTTSDPEVIAGATSLILPGVGAFQKGMTMLHELDLVEVLNHKALVEKVPVLGICLGAQLMTKGSEEGEAMGLGWLEARTVRFFRRSDGAGLKVPHMGWNDVSVRKSHPLFEDILDPRFYFVHTYHFECDNPEDVLTTTRYGYEFASSFSKESICGVQFHPEKSHRYGMRFLGNFAQAASRVTEKMGGTKAGGS